MKTFLVTVDYGDADYISHAVTISDEDFEKFLPLIEAISSFEPYIDAFGANRNNWDAMRYDMGGKRTEEIYPQFSEDLLDDFRGKFLSVHDPGGMGFHSIINIQEITLGKRYVDGNHNKWGYDLEKEYRSRIPKEYYTYKRNSDGKPINCIPFSEMTKDELELIERKDNAWLDFRPDLNRDDWYRKITEMKFDFPWQSDTDKKRERERR